MASDIGPRACGQEALASDRASGADALPDEILALAFSSVPCVRLLSTVPLVSRRWERVSRDSKAIGRRLCVARLKGRESKGHCLLAAKSGHLNCLAYARDRGRPWGRGVYLAAAAGGHLDVLRYAHSRGAPADKDVIRVAMVGGHFDCVWWLCEHGHPWGTAACDDVAGSAMTIDRLRRLREGGCPWGESILCVIASSGLMDCLEYAIENECPRHPGAPTKAACAGWLDGIKYMNAHGIACRWGEMCDAAIRAGHADVLDYALARDHEWSPRMEDISTALQFESLDLFRVLLARTSRNLPVARTAARAGRLDALRLVREAGYTLDGYVCDAAAAAGNLACLTYAFEHGCRWTADTAYEAVQRDAVDCLAYAHERGAPWHHDMMNECVRRRARRCLVYAVEHGCPML
ncbi:hypothetical protein psal_cds_914 [Pandoravirus salinus]|uniref:Ankyrin repeat domain containing protein n=1 Tax=Pandoravirus salinus TaxID=1349410 RepID=S4VXE6_9VIRU|nr:hypothetical protein psal_cds_914 [Pandoravirus salinus]AGO85028.1 hypothetical protein psal_cds_914 [Pandoravirus salinus]